MGQNLTGQLISATYEDLVQISGSLRNILTDGTGSDITSLAITASNAISASFATTASFALNVTPTNTGSLMVTGSATSNVLTFTKGDGSTFNLTVATGSAVTVDTGSLMVTGSVSSNTLTFTKGDGSTFNLTVNTGSAVTVDTGSFYLSSSVANATITFNQGDGSTEAVTVNNVSNATSASVAISASYAVSASQAQNAVTASFALSTITGTSATASFTGSTWTFNHNLNKEYVIVDCYDSNNEEIIPQTVDLTTANTATISFPVSVQGTAVASLGNGITEGISPVSVYSQQQSVGTTTYTQKLDITTATVHTIHISASGLHWVDATQLTSGTGASLNAYFYPESLTNVGDQAYVMFSVNSGSAAAITYRTLVSASAGFGYYAGGTTLGASNITVSRQTSVNQRNFGNSVNIPTIMTKAIDGTFFGGNNIPIPVTSYIYSGSNGTPI